MGKKVFLKKELKKMSLSSKFKINSVGEAIAGVIGLTVLIYFVAFIIVAASRMAFISVEVLLNVLQNL